LEIICILKYSGGLVMSYYKNKIITGVVLLILLFSIGAGFFWGRYMNQPDSRPVELILPGRDLFRARVTPETILYKEKEYLCGDLELISEEPVPGELLNLDKKALMEKFPASEGWTVNFANPGLLSLTLKTDEFCPVHRKFRHIGLYHGLIAVYEGPLGHNEKILRVENIMVESLEPEFRIKLEQSMDLENQSHFAAETLREELEFSTDETLNAALDNMDEHI
jgi:hypothetical protein